MIRAASVLALILAAFAPVRQDGQQSVAKDFTQPGDSRTFAVTYNGQVKDIPAGTKKLRVWLPVPQDSTVQKIRDVGFTRDMSLGSETKYGNRVAYAEIDN